MHLMQVFLIICALRMYWLQNCIGMASWDAEVTTAQGVAAAPGLDSSVISWGKAILDATENGPRTRSVQSEHLLILVLIGSGKGLPCGARRHI